MSQEDFRKLVKRISYVDLKGCRTEECINDRLRRINSSKLNVLLKCGFASRFMDESVFFPHPLYQKMLGMSDEEYDDWVSKL